MRVRVKHVGICVFVRESYLLRIRRDGGRERLEKETIEDRERERKRERQREREREKERNREIEKERERERERERE